MEHLSDLDPDNTFAVQLALTDNSFIYVGNQVTQASVVEKTLGYSLEVITMTDDQAGARALAKHVYQNASGRGAALHSLSEIVMATGGRAGQGNDRRKNQIWTAYIVPVPALYRKLRSGGGNARLQG